MLSSELFKEIIVENEGYVKSIDEILPREVEIPDPDSLKRLRKAVILYGVRRSGKSFILLHIFKLYPNRSLYIDFEDERLQGIQPEDLEKIWEAFLELKMGEISGDKGVFLFDEIQNVPAWEKYVRRLVEKKGVAVFCAGSSSRITPKEIHTSLRGRLWSVEVLPFSFREFAAAKLGKDVSKEMIYGDSKAQIKRLFLEYIKYGGMPEVVFARNEFEKKKIIKEYLNSMYFRDMVERYTIKNVPLLDALWDSLFSSHAAKFSVNGFYKRYKGLLSFSKDTLYGYYHHFLESMLLFEVRKFTQSSYKKMRNPAKIYLVDHGLARKVSSENFGRILENVVYIQLRRKGYDVHYFEEEGHECDFIALNGQTLEAYQVTWELTGGNEKREIEGLLVASSYTGAQKLTILTHDQEGTMNVGGKKIEILPAWKWLVV
ncbi:MAG: ATP-binding protein [Thermotogae bacterium]|nr:ATP-binding protein [Thermotogota bacterium]